ncbi:hypothetical protein GCM10028895_01530 [Pontibacter rugosus]
MAPTKDGFASIDGVASAKLEKGIRLASAGVTPAVCIASRNTRRSLLKDMFKGIINIGVANYIDPI